MEQKTTWMLAIVDIVEGSLSKSNLLVRLGCLYCLKIIVLQLSTRSITFWAKSITKPLKLIEGNVRCRANANSINRIRIGAIPLARFGPCHSRIYTSMQQSKPAEIRRFCNCMGHWAFNYPSYCWVACFSLKSSYPGECSEHA